MKPIEAGCMAIIVKGSIKENIGRVVKVLAWGEAPVRLEGTCRGYFSESGWLLEGDMFCQRITPLGVIEPALLRETFQALGFTFNGMLPTDNLMRIDGLEDEERIEEYSNRIVDAVLGV